MIKKTISILLCVTMLVCTCPDAFAATAEETTPPSIEDILAEYHLRCDTVRQSNNDSDASNMTASTADMQLAAITADTIDTLNAAGYQAYDVNPKTYSSVETALNTDFEKMGLNPDSSYLVVLSGEEVDSSVSTASYQPAATTGTSFEYTLYGVTYTMRYVTVTSADKSSFAKFDNANLIEEIDIMRTVESKCNSAVAYLLDVLSEPYPIGTLADFAGIQLVNIDTSSPNATATLNAGAQWTRVFTQIYDSYGNYWETWGSVDSVSFRFFVDGMYLDKNTNEIKEFHSGTQTGKVDSNYYKDEEFRNYIAVMAMFDNYPIHYHAGSVQFYLGSKKVLTLSNPTATSP